VESQCPSIQGEWHERMDLVELSFQIKHLLADEKGAAAV
jgi:hypothetical protein